LDLLPEDNEVDRNKDVEGHPLAETLNVEIDQAAVDCSVEGHQEIEVDRLSLDSLEGSQAFVEDLENQVASDDQNTTIRSNLFKSERSSEKMQYFAPQKSGGKTIVCPPDDVVAEGINNWKASLVGQFLDKPLPFFLVKKSVAIMWKDFGEVEVFSLENGMFIFRFLDGSVCDEVLESKLWHIANKPLILRKWKPGMQVLKLTLTSIPVWVNFLHLPLEFWSPSCLCYVASGVGKPIYVDKVTEDQKRLGFARVLVEIDMNSDCPKEIEIQRSNGEVVTVGVVYPWLPPKCSVCKGFGHAAFACSKKEKQVWIPKGQAKGVQQKKFEVGQNSKAFNKVISKPKGFVKKKVFAVGQKPKAGVGGVRLSNSFSALRSSDKGVDEEVENQIRPPSTFLDIFENALASNDKGKAKVGEFGGSSPERGFSPHPLL